MKKICKLLLFAGLFTSVPLNAQVNDIKLDLLFDTWAIIGQDGSSKNLVVEKSKASKRNSGSNYNFKIGQDSIIYRDKILSRIGGCLTPPIQRTTLGYEVWTLDAQKARLRYDIYFDSITNKKPADYSIIYKIESLDKEYLKLQLLKELFEGVE